MESIIESDTQKCRGSKIADFQIELLQQFENLNEISAEILGEESENEGLFSKKKLLKF